MLGNKSAGLVKSSDRTIGTRNDGNATRNRNLTGGSLITHCPQGIALWTNEGNSILFAQGGKFCIF